MKPSLQGTASMSLVAPVPEDLPCVLLDPGAEQVSADASLVSRLRAGEIAALGEAYRMHHAHVRAFARRFLGDEDSAEDLLQETFIALPRAMRGFREDACLRTFLVSVALNHARHHLRAAARRRAAIGRLARACEVSCGEARTPDDDVSRGQLAAALLRALDKLPIEQ